MKGQGQVPLAYLSLSFVVPFEDLHSAYQVMLKQMCITLEDR